ncbi:MAG: N-acetyl-gamma-glutamyl-phosphate reductase, partial [Elusimicrobiota bacterium]
MNKNIAVSIYGATGFTGRELLKILCRHKGVHIDKLYSRSYAGSRISDIFPALKGVIDKKLSSPDPEKVPLNSDAVFLALPHMKSMEYVPRLRDKGILTVDMSADYRFSDWGAYEKEYGCRHTDRENIKKAVYGLSEINRESIREASLIANPGCYATALILALYPLLKKKLLIGPAYADAKSGISGAGKKLHENFLFASRNENLTPYKVNTHRHRGEVKEFLSGACSGRWSG